MQTSVNREYGPHRRPMGGARSVFSSQAAGRWPRGDRGRRHAPCSTAFCGFCAPALPGTICPIAIRPTKPVIDAFNSGSAPGCSRPAAETGRGLTRPRQTRSERSVHRRQLQFGEKRGSSVGPTKRGKGSKIVAIADRHGLPVAVHVASARPNEAILVEATLEQRFLPRSSCATDR